MVLFETRTMRIVSYTAEPGLKLTWFHYEGRLHVLLQLGFWVLIAFKRKPEVQAVKTELREGSET